MRKKLLALLLVTAAALVVAAVSYAAFSNSVSVTQAVSSDTLQPPGSVAANLTSTKCNKPQQVTITWTASASSYATGYTVQRNGTTLTTLPSTATSYVDNTPAHTTAYTYTVLTTYLGWSAGASSSVTTC